MRKSIKVVLSAVVAGLALATPAAAQPDRAALAPSGEMGVLFNCESYSTNAPMTRADMLSRSTTWLQARVPYSQSACHRNQHGSFRTDCSGYLSMVWGLKHSYTTDTLHQVSHTIARGDLRPGDALNRSGEHVAMFLAWEDAAKTRPRVREQAGPDGAPTVERVWSAATANTYTPIRYDNVRDSSVMGGPEVVLWANGTIGTYAVHADGNVHGRGQEAPGGAFTAWQQLSAGGGFAGRPSLVQMPDGTVNLYARTTSGTIVGTGNSAGPGSDFKPWQQVSPSGGAAVAGDPEVFVRPDGTIATYAVLADGSVNGMSQATPGGDFSGWQRLSEGGFTGKPSVLQAADGRVDLYVTTTGGAIMGTGNSAGPGSDFKPWQQVSPSGATAVSGGPEVYLRSDNTIGVYAVLADGSVNGMSQSTPGGAFSGWQRLSGGGYVDSPSVVQHSDGRVDLYVRGSDWTLWGNGNKNGPGSNWGDWTRVG
jgi:hypothetical protein